MLIFGEQLSTVLTWDHSANAHSAKAVCVYVQTPSSLRDTFESVLWSPNTMVIFS